MSREIKVTMKITDEAHNKLQLVKAHLKSKTYSQAIQELAERYLATHRGR